MKTYNVYCGIFYLGKVQAKSEDEALMLAKDLGRQLGWNRNEIWIREEIKEIV